MSRFSAMSSPTSTSGFSSPSGLSRSIVSLQRQKKRERGALTHFARDRDAAAEHAGKAAADREAEARAGVRARDGGIELAKVFEDALVIAGRDADARVG